MRSRDPSGAVDEKRGRQRLHTSISLGRLIVAHHQAVVDSHLRGEGFYDFPTFVVHGDSQHFKTAIFVLALHFHEPWDLDLTRTAPGGPEIQQHYFALVLGEAYRLAFPIFEGKFGSRLAILVRFDGSRADRPEIQRAAGCEAAHEERGCDGGVESQSDHSIYLIRLYRQFPGFDG